MFSFVIQCMIGSQILWLCLWTFSNLHLCRVFGLDKVCRKPAKSRDFKVSGYYHSLSSPIVISFPWKMVWQSKVPRRVAFFHCLPL